MFLPANHPTIEKIESIDLVKLLFKGEVARCYEYRNQVLMYINQAISEVDDTTTLDEDLEIIYQWFLYRNHAKYWETARKQKTPAEMAEWILGNAAKEVEDRDIENSFLKAAGVPSDADREDVYQWVESSIVGSEKQIRWAKDIAHKYHDHIALAWKKGKKVPAEAKWWIDNRNNVLTALNSI